MIALHGGPMDGWLVLPGAPALRPDWYRTLPRPPAREGLIAFLVRRARHQPPPPLPDVRPGRYVVDGMTATWQEG